ncbi:uncharacterized protein LOC144129697, partial [Amblyomma americanum]
IVKRAFLRVTSSRLPPLPPGSKGKGSRAVARLVCRYCGYVSSNANYLAHHERTHTGERPFPCPVCPKAFNWKVDLKRHLRTHTGEKPFPCSLCGRSFRIRSHLTGHLRCHSTERPYRCTRCPMRFTQSSGLARHMHVHSVPPLQQAARLLSSDVWCFAGCGSQWPPSAITEATGGHRISPWHGQRVPSYPPPCYSDAVSAAALADVTLDSNSTGSNGGGNKEPEWRMLLRTRLRNHAAERPFKCRLCPRSFTQSSHLNRHCLSHTGQQPFKCRFCDKRFARSDNCKTHERSHMRAMGRL